MRKPVVIFFLCSSALFFSCEKDIGPVIKAPDVPVKNFVSFSNDIQPIFNANCIVCHTEFHPFLNLKPCCSWDELLVSGSSAPYIDTLSPLESYLYIMVAGADMNPAQMPPGGPYLPKSETDKILKWIQEGAKNN